jgi:hypothetical protein
MPRAFDDAHKGTSEFGGAVGPAGVAPKGRAALTAQEKLQLGYLTGTEDPEAPVDERWFQGEDPAKWDALRERFPLPNPGAAIPMWAQYFENFNKADGTLGPQQTWTREIFTHPNAMKVQGSRLVLEASGDGTYEDIAVPTANVTGDMECSLDIPVVTHSGVVGNYVVDFGAIFRYMKRSDTTYDGYAFGVGRDNIFVGTADLWHLMCFRIDNGVPTLFSSPGQLSVVVFASVTPPLKLAASMIGPNFKAKVTHAGVGPPMEINITDYRYAGGKFALGGSVEGHHATASSRIEVDNVMFAGQKP